MEPGNPISLRSTERERRRLRRWVTDLLGRDSPHIETQTRALDLLFEAMLRDRIPAVTPGPLGAWRQRIAALNRARATSRRQRRTL